MSSNDEDEALTWAGGRDPSHYETPVAKVPKARGKAAVLSAVARDDEELPPAMSAAVLLSLGILGGIYLLYTVGWFISWQRLVDTNSDALEVGAFRVQQVLAILAPPLWFVVTLLFTRERKPAVRLLWLVAGALVLVPWSFTFGR